MPKPGYFDDSLHDGYIEVPPDKEGWLPTGYNSRFQSIYIDGSIPENHESRMDQGALYITGDVGPGACVSAEGISSARSIQKNAEIRDGTLLILSNEALSYASKNMDGMIPGHPPIIFVPEDKRAEVFSIAARTIGPVSVLSSFGLKKFKAELDKEIPR